MSSFIKLVIFFLCILNLQSQTIFTFAGTGIMANTGDGGPANLAQVANPFGIVTDAAGNVYFGSGNLVRKVNTTGVISTIAGGGASYGEGGPATSAKLMSVYGITMDTSGNIYIVDRINQCVRKVSTTGIITTIAGNNIAGFAGDGGLATLAKLNDPVAIAHDNIGNIYIADCGNNRVRMVNTSGIIKTLAGNGYQLYNGDGGQADTTHINPQGLEIDIFGNIYVSDFANSRIRKIDNSGIVTTIAGTGVQGNSGDGGMATVAKIGGPRGLCFDGSGNLYFVDYYYATVRKIDNSGIISTIAGTGVSGYSGDNGPATLAQLDPQYLTIDINGKLYITDSGNQRVRVIICSSGSGCITGLEKQNITNNFIVFPNPATNILQINDENHMPQNSNIEIVNNIGQSVFMQSYSDEIDVSGLSPGLYTLKIVAHDKETFYSKFIKE